MAGVELISLNWGHQTMEYSKVWERSVEVFKVEEANVAGGVDIKTEIYNASDKVIKYITFSYVAYNAVGDVISCTIKKKNVVAGKLTGPIGVNKTATAVFENMWYNNTVSKIAIKEITVQYMDDSLETIAGKELVCVYNGPHKTRMNYNSVYYEKRGRAEEAAARAEEERERKRKEEERKQAEERKKENEKAAVRSRIMFGIIVAAIVVFSIVVGCCFGV